MESIKFSVVMTYGIETYANSNTLGVSLDIYPDGLFTTAQLREHIVESFELSLKTSCYLKLTEQDRLELSELAGRFYDEYFATVDMDTLRYFIAQGIQSDWLSNLDPGQVINKQLTSGTRVRTRWNAGVGDMNPYQLNVTTYGRVAERSRDIPVDYFYG